MSEQIEHINIGKISGIFGVKGWIKVFSHCEPRENIVKYKHWFISKNNNWQEIEVSGGKPHGKTIVAKLVGVDTPEEARKYIGAEIAISVDQLPNLKNDQYYWRDLEGLEVITESSINLGIVEWLFETGSNSVMVVQPSAEADDSVEQKERFIPFIRDDVVKSIDLEQKQIVVDWDPDF